MGKNKGSGRALTQEEIWDDSALVHSWDEAVEEYKLYHSIAAKGENVEDVLREAQAAAEADAGPSLAWAKVDDEVDDDMADAQAEPSAVETNGPETTNVSEARQDIAAAAEVEPAAAAGPAQPPMPMAFPQVQDEGLKNVMMAWYYAGYYTALYEEQQRANAGKSS
ncbi:hypothetical protein BDV18DRAFT_94895 [Aspergillus unguis]